MFSETELNLVQNLIPIQMGDVVENEAKMAYMRPSGSSAAAMEEHRGPSKGFVVREAPWTTGNEKVSTFLQFRYCMEMKICPTSFFLNLFFIPSF